MIALCLAVANLTSASAAQASQQAPTQQPQAKLLKVGDKINILVEGEDDLTGFYTINKAGMINMPLIGKVLVAGITTHEAKIMIAQILQDGYLRQPNVTVKNKQKKETGAKLASRKPLEQPQTKDDEPTISATLAPAPQTKENAKQIYIVGAINNPGYYTLPADAGHILNIIALAGGYTDNANKVSFELVRNIDGKYYRKQAQIGALDYHDDDIIIISAR